MKKFQPIIKRSAWQLGLAGLLLLGATTISQAQDGTVSLTASDASGSTSWNTAGHWSNAAAPAAGNNYYTAGWLLRTPGSGTSATFAGDSLTLSPNANSLTTAALNLKLGNNGVTIINNCTNAGGPIADGNGGDTYFVSGNMYFSTATAFWVQNDASRLLILTNINMTGSGAANLITNGMTGNGLGTIVWAGNATGLTCPVTVDNWAVFKLYSQTNLGGNPSSFNAAQLLLNGAVVAPLGSFALGTPNSGITITPNGAAFNIPASLVLTNNDPLAGAGPLTNSGAGKLILNGSGAGYTGTVNANAGTLAIGASGTLPNSPINVGSGGTLDVTAAGFTLGATQSLSGAGTVLGNLTDSSTSLIYPGGATVVGNLTFGNNLVLVNGGQLVYDFSGSTSDLINVSGNLSPSGTTLIDLANVPAAGVYTLMTVSGTMGGSPANFKVSAASTRTRSYALSYSSGHLLLTVTSSGATGNDVWVGDVTNGVANAWDIDTSTNWEIGTTPAVYFDADNVFFTDAGTNLSGTINQPTLDVVVNPGSVTVNSTNNDYVLASPTGLGSIAGPTSLTKSGPSTLTIQLTNTYTGGTLVNGGVLSVSGAPALGNPGANPLVAVTNGGSFDLSGQVFTTKSQPILAAGTGIVTNGNGALVAAVFTSHGMGCPVGCNVVGISALRLSGNTVIGEDGGTWQFGQDVNANGSVPGLVDARGFALTKVGNNQLVLECTNASAASLFSLGGGGVIWANTAGTPFGTTCPIVLSNNAWIDTWDNYQNAGVTFNNAFTTTNGGGILQNTRGMYYNHACYNTYNGTVTLNDQLTILNTSTYGGGPNNVPTYGSMTFNGVISGSGPVNVAGGTSSSENLDGYRGGNLVTFAGNNTYTGPTMVSNLVQLLVTSSSQAAGPYDVVDNGTLDVALASGHPTLNASSLLLDVQTAGPGNLAFTRISSLSATAPVIYATNLVINYGTIIPPSAGYQVGQFPLVKYSGSIGGNGFDGLSLGPLPNFVTATLVNNTANHSIDLLVTTTGLEWTGTNSSSWDYSTYNWLDPDGSTADLYADGDAVNFNDATTNYVVSIPANVTPGGITVNTTNEYYFGGTAGIIGSASLIKTGLGILSVANSNNVFTGGTFINQGTLQLADLSYGYPYPGGALNDNLGVVTVANGGTLDVNGIEVPNYQSYGPDGYNVFITGAGVNGNGALVNNNTSNNDNADAGYVTLAGNATVGGLGDVNVRHGANPQLSSQSGAYVLTKVGPGQFRVRYNTVVSTNFGSIIILQGNVSYESSNPNGFGDPTKPIYIGSGAGFALGAPNPFSKLIIASNNATIYCYSGGSVLASPVLLTGGTITINANYFNAITFSNVLSGPAGVTISYNSPVTFAAPNTYTGNTYVQDCNSSPGSVLHLTGNGSFTNSPTIQLQGIISGQAYPGGLDVSGRVDGTLTLVNSQTFRGDNGSFVNGSVVATAGTTLTPGGLNNIQYFNVSNNVTLQAGSTVVADVSIDSGSPSNDVINVTGALAYGGTLQLNASGTVPLTSGSAFKLFSFGSQSGNFTTLAGSPGAGLGWSFNPATGVATVVATLPSTPTNLTYSVSGNQLNLSWPANYQGWLVQSNSQKVNVAADWFDISNTASGTSYSVTITPGVTNVFYRMRHP